jgi:hypothetical protein
MQGMPIDSSVAELITAQLFVLVQEAPEPIYFYINSTGIAVSSKGSRGGICSSSYCRGSSRRTGQEICHNRSVTTGLSHMGKNVAVGVGRATEAAGIAASSTGSTVSSIRGRNSK